MVRIYNIGEEVLYNGNGFDSQNDYEEAQRVRIKKHYSFYEIEVLDGNKAGKIMKMVDSCQLESSHQSEMPSGQKSKTKTQRQFFPSNENLSALNFEDEAVFLESQDVDGMSRKWKDTQTNSIIKLENWNGNMILQVCKIYAVSIAQKPKPSEQKHSYEFKGHQIDQLEDGLYKASKAKMLAINFDNLRSAITFYDKFLEMAGLNKTQKFNTSQASNTMLSLSPSNSKSDPITTKKRSEKYSPVLRRVLPPTLRFGIHVISSDVQKPDKAHPRVKKESKRPKYHRKTGTWGGIKLQPLKETLSRISSYSFPKSRWICSSCGHENNRSDHECTECIKSRPGSTRETLNLTDNDTYVSLEEKHGLMDRPSALPGSRRGLMYRSSELPGMMSIKRTGLKFTNSARSSSYPSSCSDSARESYDINDIEYEATEDNRKINNTDYGSKKE